MNVGIDIEEIKRFREKPFPKNISFYKKIFTDLEIEYCNKKHDPYIHFMGKFTAKEAVIKAVSSVMKLTISQIEIINNGDGSPQVSILGQDGKNLSQSIKISISHTNDHAAAVAIAIHR